MKQLILYIFITFTVSSFAQTDSAAFLNSLNKLNNDNKKLNLRIDELSKNFDKYKESAQTTIDSLKMRLNTVETINTNLLDENKKLKKEMESEKSYREKNIEDISSKFLKSNLIGAIITVIIFVVILFFVFVIIRKFKESNKTAEEKSLKIDKELLELMSKQMNIIKKSENSKDLKEAPETVDHSLAVKVADEINRINMRIVKMDDKSRDVIAVKNALKRIESELNQQGYEIIIRSGEPFTDTCTFNPVNFIKLSGLNPGEQIILRTIKPQITYKFKLIQQGEIEVGVNENDLV